MLRAKAVLAVMGRTVLTRYLPMCSVLMCSALTCLSGCGSSGSPTSSGPSISSVSISPSTINLQVQQQRQFTAKVSGTGSYSSAVQWFVNGVAGGDGTVGTIVTGLYTAPGQPPSTPTVNIQVVSTGDPTKSAVAQATIRGVLSPAVVWNETNLSLSGGDDGEVFASEIPLGIAVADDGAGGAYIVWEHRFPVEILAQHLDTSGQPTWAAGGIPVTNPWTGYQALPRVVSDGLGGVIVVWLDGRVGICDPSFMADCDIYGQRLDSNGTLLWGPAGKPVATAANTQGVSGLAVVSDGSGGTIVGFSDARATEGTQVYAQRIDGNGNPVWPVDGILIGQAPNNQDVPSIANLKLIADGAGGAIGAWYFTSYIAPSTVSMQSQRISGTGQLLWGAAPITVPGVSATDPNGTGIQSFDMANDGSGGTIIGASWTSGATPISVLAQQIKSDGSIGWPQSGTPVSNSSNDGLNPAVLADGSGGIFVAWQDCTRAGEVCDIVMQHLNGRGQRTWGQNQLYVVQAANQQLAPTLQPDGTGGALVMWTDCRAYSDPSLCENNSDVYAQDMDASGNPLWQLNGYPLLADPGNQGEQYYIYTPPPATAAVRLQSGDIFLAWPDGRDNICFTINAASACEVFVERFKF